MGALCACTEREVIDEPRVLAMTPRQLHLEKSVFALEDEEDEEDFEARVKKEPGVELQSGWEEYYVLNQSIAICRHADRLDDDDAPKWESHKDHAGFPNDPPLSSKGIEYARNLGETLRDMKKPFKVVVSSPYYRCAQTACCIAEKLNIPVCFDQDLGEVFDETTMGKKWGKRIPFRPPKLLESHLQAEFQGIEYRRDTFGELKIAGVLPRFPEQFDSACARYSFVIMKLIQQAVADLCSIVIVTHGNALSTVLGMLRERWTVDAIPYASYIFAERQVKVMAQGVSRMMIPEPVYANSDQWTIKLHPGIVVREGDEERARLEKNASLRRLTAVKDAFRFEQPYSLSARSCSTGGATAREKSGSPRSSRTNERCFDSPRECPRGCIPSPRRMPPDAACKNGSSPKDVPPLTARGTSSARSNGSRLEFQEFVLRFASVGRGVCSPRVPATTSALGDKPKVRQEKRSQSARPLKS